MKKVLFVALLSALSLAGPARAQDAPDIVPPVPPQPPASPSRLAQAAPPAPAPRPAPAPPAARSPQAPPAPSPAPTARAPQAPPAAVRPATPSRPAAVPAPAAAPEPPRVPRNVRFDITITDSAGGKPVTKSLSVTVSDSNGNGSIRNLGTLPTGNYPLNVDVRNVVWHSDTVVRASVNIEYQPYIPDAKPQPGLVTATANSVFQDGRRTQILQAAESTSDRRTTIEVTATILK